MIGKTHHFLRSVFPGLGAVRSRAAGPPVSLDPNRIAAGGGSIEGNRPFQSALLHEVAGGWLGGRMFSFWPLQIGGWTFALLFPWVIWLSGTVTDPPVLWLSFSRPFSGFLITLMLRPYCSRVFSRVRNPYRLMPVLLFVALVTAYLELKGASWLVWLSGLPDVPKQTWVGFWLFRMVTLLIWLLLYFGIKSYLRHSEIEREFQRAQVRLLRAQVDPHFLFNALATIMAVRKSEEQVALVTQSLADYLRFSLTQEEQDQIQHPLGQELAALESYLEVEKIRFQHNLQTRIEVNDEARAARVPSALIQPLLENAIKYGQQTSPRPLCIAIGVQLSEGKLQLTVENSGHWVEPDPTHSCGIGIANLRKRLQLLYADQAQVTFDCTPASVKVRISLPIPATA